MNSNKIEKLDDMQMNKVKGGGFGIALAVAIAFYLAGHKLGSS